MHVLIDDKGDGKFIDDNQAIFAGSLFITS